MENTNKRGSVNNIQILSSTIPIIQGIFCYEEKNRFLCVVNVNGEAIVCYIPSSCRLSNFIDLKNKVVLLRPVMAADARTKYSVYAVKYGKNYILVNLSVSNKVIEKELSRRYFSFLGKRKQVSHEVVIDGYKSDLFIKDTNTIIEIKSILSLDREAAFPTVYSERSLKQLENLKELLENGYKVCYIFVSLNPYLKRIMINSEMEFYKLFVKCVERGMTYRGFSVHLNNGEASIYSKIQVAL